MDYKTNVISNTSRETTGSGADEGSDCPDQANANRDKTHPTGMSKGLRLLSIKERQTKKLV